MSPQPRPRSKAPRSDDGDGEVLTPDVVSGPDDVTVEDPAEPPTGKPDRGPLWALVAGLSAVWFAFLGSILSFVLAPLAIVLGFRQMRRIDEGRGDPTQRRKAKIGFIAGILATAFIVVQVVLFALFFEWDKSPDEDFELNTTDKTEVTTPASEGEREG